MKKEEEKNHTSRSNHFWPYEMDTSHVPRAADGRGPKRPAQPTFWTPCRRTPFSATAISRPHVCTATVDARTQEAVGVLAVCLRAEYRDRKSAVCTRHAATQARRTAAPGPGPVAPAWPFVLALAPLFGPEPPGGTPPRRSAQSVAGFGSLLRGRGPILQVGNGPASAFPTRARCAAARVGRRTAGKPPDRSGVRRLLPTTRPPQGSPAR